MSEANIGLELMEQAFRMADARAQAAEAELDSWQKTAQDENDRAQELEVRLEAAEAERDIHARAADSLTAKLAAAERVVEAARELKLFSRCETPDDPAVCENETHHLNDDAKCIEDGLFLAFAAYAKAYISGSQPTPTTERGGGSEPPEDSSKLCVHGEDNDACRAHYGSADLNSVQSEET